MSNTFDVVVVGAGPVGLFTACELAQAGVSVLVLEKDESPKSPWKEGPLGRRGINVRGVETFYRRGLIDKLFGDAERPHTLTKTEGIQFAGHFAGMFIDGNKLDLSRWRYHLPGPAFMPGGSTLGHIGSILTERAEALGVQIRRGTTVSKIEDDDTTVKIWADDETFTTQWLVGCDGGRSTIRKLAGFDFDGTDPVFTGYAVGCDLDKPELLKPGFIRTNTGMHIALKPESGVLFAIDFDMGFDRSKPVTREHFQEVLRRVSGTEIGVTALHLGSSFTDRSKQATEYRRGRVLLAGDSAHIHSPLGAQGLNTGLGDAMNLGWKLAATIKGTAPAGLLDTYHQERHPIGAWVLEWTRAQVSTLRPGLFGQAVGNMMQDLINTVDGANYFADRFWGLSQRYDLGEEHPLVGASAPDFEFAEGQRFGPKLEEGRFWVVDFEGSSAVEEYVQSEALKPHVEYYRAPSTTKDTCGLKALLVRPDGTVAWATDGDVDVGSLKTALSRWLSVGGVEA